MVALANNPKFQVGQMVEWDSQARGTKRTKIGVVIDKLPPRQTIKSLKNHLDYKLAPSSSLRNHESYIIAVIHPHKKPEFFHPLVKNLRKATRYLPLVLPKKNMTLKPII